MQNCSAAFVPAVPAVMPPESVSVLVALLFVILSALFSTVVALIVSPLLLPFWVSTAALAPLSKVSVAPPLEASV